jgi:hypothetical protein
MIDDTLELRKWKKPSKPLGQEDIDLFKELMGWEIVEERFDAKNTLVADLRWKKDVELYESYVYNKDETSLIGKYFQSKTAVGAKFKADIYLKSLGYIFDNILSE